MADTTTNLSLKKRYLDDPVSLSYFNENMDIIDRELGEVPDKLNVLEAKMRVHTADIATINDTISADEQRIDGLDGVTTNHEVRLQAIEAIDPTQTNKIGGLEDTSEDHEIRIGTLELDDENHDERISTLENSVTNHGTRLGNLETSASTQDTRLTTAEQNIAAETTRVTALQNKLNEEVDDIHGKIDLLADVAKSGDYNDLSNKPHIPSTVAELSDHSNYELVSDFNTKTATNGTAPSGSIGAVVRDHGKKISDLITVMPYAERSSFTSAYAFDSVEFITALYAYSATDVLGNSLYKEDIKTAVTSANQLLKIWGTAGEDNFIALVDRKNNEANCLVVLFVKLAAGGSISGIWTKVDGEWTWTQVGSGSLKPEDLEPIYNAIEDNTLLIGTNANDIADNAAAIRQNATNIATNIQDIATLKGADNVNGSIAKSIKDAIANANIPTPETMNALETAISNTSNTIAILQGGVNTQGSIDQRIKYAVEHVDISGNLDYQAVNAKALANETAIATLNGDAQTQGSVDYKIKQAKDTIDQSITNLDLTNYTAFTNATSAISDNADAITTLNGDNQTAGSVDYKIKQAIDSIDLDQVGDFTNLSSAVNTNTSDITTLKGNDQTQGSVDYKIKQATDPINTTLTNHTNAINTLNGNDQTQGSVDYKIKQAVDALDIPAASDLTTLANGISANATAITTLNGDNQTQGSVAYNIKQATDPINTAITTLNANDQTQGSVDYKIKTAIDALDIPSAADLSALTSDTTANTTAINTLNGNAATEGSVDYKIAQALSDPDLDNNTDFTALKTRVTNTEASITTLNGNNQTQGSVDYKIKQAIDALSIPDGASITQLTAAIEANANAISTLNGSGSGSIQGAIDGALGELIIPDQHQIDDIEFMAIGNKDAIDLLNEGSSVQGSVDYKIQNAINHLDLTGNTDISNLSTGLATLSTTVSGHTTTLNTLTGDDQTEGSVDYKVKTAVDSLTTDVTTPLGTRVTALENDNSVDIIDERLSRLEKMVISGVKIAPLVVDELGSILADEDGNAITAKWKEE